MKIKFFFPVLLAALALVSLSCSDGEDIVFENPSDPFSNIYDPGAPDSLKATVEADSGITLSWKSTSRMEKGFRIYKQVGTYGSYKKIAEVPARTTTYFDAFPVKAGTTYYYWVASLIRDRMANVSKETTVTASLLPPK